MSNFNVSNLINLLFDNKILKGTISIPQTLINTDLKMLIMEQIGNTVDDYKITFENNFIFMKAIAHLGQLGKIQANYKLHLESFVFNHKDHKLQFTYGEDVKSQGNIMQSVALKAASVNGSYLKTAIEVSRNKSTGAKSDAFISAVSVTNNTITLDLNKLDIAKQLPPSLELGYIGCSDGILKFKIL